MIESARSVFGAGLLSLVAAACSPGHLLSRPAGCVDEAAGSWTVVATATHPLPSEKSLQALSTAVFDGTVYYTGVLTPPTGAEASEQHSPVVGRLDTGLVEPPGFSRWAREPRLVAAGDRLVLLWGEPGDTTDLVPVRFGYPVESVWFSVHSPPSGWSAPAELFRDTATISWTHTFGAVDGTPEGDVHLAFRNNLLAPSTLYYGVIPAVGAPRVSEIALQVPTSYMAILPREASILLAVGATMFGGSGFPTVHLLQSEDGGRTWSEPRHIREVDEPSVRAVNLARTADGAVHLVVALPESPEASWMNRLRHFTSRDDGRTWSAEGMFDVPNVQTPQLGPDSCGGAHFTVRAMAPPDLRVLHSRWGQGRWTALEPLFQAIDPSSHVLLPSPGGPHLVLQHGVTYGSLTLTWARFGAH